MPGLGVVVGRRRRWGVGLYSLFSGCRGLRGGCGVTGQAAAMGLGVYALYAL